MVFPNPQERSGWDMFSGLPPWNLTAADHPSSSYNCRELSGWEERKSLWNSSPGLVCWRLNLNKLIGVGGCYPPDHLRADEPIYVELSLAIGHFNDFICCSNSTVQNLQTCLLVNHFLLPLPLSARDDGIHGRSFGKRRRQDLVYSP